MAVIELCKLIKSLNPTIRINRDKNGSELWFGSKKMILNKECLYAYNAVKHFDADFYDECIILYV